MTQYNQKPSALRCLLCKVDPEHLPIPQLFRCQNCKLISYCGRDHQKEHWIIHKSFCRAIKLIMEKWKLENVLDINGNVTQLTALELREVKFMIEAMVQAKLYRNLTEDERELIWFPCICNLSSCNSYERASYFCVKCSSVCYCSEEHRLEDMPEHSIICSQLHLRYNFRLEELPEYDVKFIPCKSSDNGNFPKDLFDLHKLSTNFLEKDYSYDYCHLNLPTTSLDYQTFANICNFSNVATILHIFYLIQDYKIKETSTLTIHIVGANSEILLFTRYECWLLFYLLPTVSHIRLIFIGPELVVDDGVTEIPYESSVKKSVEIISKKTKYENFMRADVKEDNLTEPNLIVCFNCGFSEFENTSNAWRLAISVILTFKNIPIAFTSYTKTQAISDLSVLRRVAVTENCDIDVICDGKLNYLRDYRTLKNFIGLKTESIYYSNGYISVVMVK